MARVRGRAILCHNFKLICPVQFRSQKYSASLPPQITSTNPVIPFRERGVGHRHERWDGMRWTRQHRARLRSQGGFRERLCSAQDERRFNASARISADCTRTVEGLVEVAAYGKAVWSWHPLLVSSWRRFS
jgi:hypothetical protein